MPGQIEYMHHAFLFGLALECLAAGNRLGERRGAAVHVLDGFPKLVNVTGHADHHSHHGERRHARAGRFGSGANSLPASPRLASGRGRIDHCITP